MSEHKINQAETARMKVVHRYIQALERGDLEAASTALEAALDDDELDRMLAEVDQTYLEEQGLTPMAADTQLVRDLAREHLPSAFAEEDLANTPLTVGDVAARLQADRRVAALDQEVHHRLLASSTPIPSWLSMQAIRNLAKDIGVVASDRFWRKFRDTAITLGMGRSHSQAQLAAAREARGGRQITTDDTKTTGIIPPSAEEQNE